MRPLFPFLLMTMLLAVSGCGTPERDAAVAPQQSDVAPTDVEQGETDQAPVASAEADNGSALRLAAPAIEGLADDDVGLLARIHFATHTPDFDRARAFYRELGYTEGITGFPLTNTHLMARALGMFDVCQYELAKGEVMAMPQASNPASIDLLQFKTPFNGSPPYERPNHLGIAWAAFATSQFDQDVARLRQLGADFLGPSFGNSGARFVFFRDPDGVLYKLIEAPVDAAPVGDMHIFDMPYITINVSDMEESLAFYARLGYVTLGDVVEHRGGLEEAQAYGLEQPFVTRSVDIGITRGDEHRIRMVQWLEPYDPEPPYPAPINHIGMQRVALLVTNLDRAVDILKRQDVPFLSELAPCCSGTGEDTSAIVHAIDPDGVFVELVGSITPRAPAPHPEWCPPLEIKVP